MLVKDIISANKMRQWPVSRWADFTVDRESCVVEKSKDLPPHNHLWFKVCQGTIRLHYDFPEDVVLVVMEQSI